MVSIKEEIFKGHDIWYYANLRVKIDVNNNAGKREEIMKKIEIDLPQQLKELNFECSLIEQGDVDEKDYFFEIGISRQKYDDFKNQIITQYHTNIELSPYQIYNWIKNSILNCKELKFLKEKQYKTKIFAKPVYKYEKLNLLLSLLKPELYWEKNGHPIFNEILGTSGPANALYFLFLFYYIVSLFFLAIFSVLFVLSQYNIIDHPYKLVVQCSIGVFIVLYCKFLLDLASRDQLNILEDQKGKNTTHRALSLSESFRNVTIQTNLNLYVTVGEKGLFLQDWPNEEYSIFTLVIKTSEYVDSKQIIVVDIVSKNGGFLSCVDAPNQTNMRILLPTKFNGSPFNLYQMKPGLWAICSVGNGFLKTIDKNVFCVNNFLDNHQTQETFKISSSNYFNSA